MSSTHEFFGSESFKVNSKRFCDLFDTEQGCHLFRHDNYCPFIFSDGSLLPSTLVILGFDWTSRLSKLDELVENLLNDASAEVEGRDDVTKNINLSIFSEDFNGWDSEIGQLVALRLFTKYKDAIIGLKQAILNDADNQADESMEMFMFLNQLVEFKYPFDTSVCDKISNGWIPLLQGDTLRVTYDVPRNPTFYILPKSIGDFKVDVEPSSPTADTKKRKVVCVLRR